MAGQAMCIPRIVTLAVLGLVILTPAGTPAKEFLTQAEIDKIQEAQEIDRRVKIYMEAAALRLKASQERINGKESEPGDPLEFFSVEDMLDGYYRIIRSAMFSLDGALQKPSPDRASFVKALKALKEGTEKSARELKILKQLAEDKKLESVWNLVNQAIDIAAGAHEGAELGLSREPKEQEPEGKKKKKS